MSGLGRVRVLTSFYFTMRECVGLVWIGLECIIDGELGT